MREQVTASLTTALWQHIRKSSSCLFLVFSVSREHFFPNDSPFQTRSLHSTKSFADKDSYNHKQSKSFSTSPRLRPIAYAYSTSMSKTSYSTNRLDSSGEYIFLDTIRHILFDISTTRTLRRHIHGWQTHNGGDFFFLDIRGQYFLHIKILSSCDF